MRRPNLDSMLGSAPPLAVTGCALPNSEALPTLMTWVRGPPAPAISVRTPRQTMISATATAKSPPTIRVVPTVSMDGDDTDPLTRCSSCVSDLAEGCADSAPYRRCQEHSSPARSPSGR